MADSYRTLLLTLLPLVGCPLPKDDDETGTSDTSVDSGDTDSGDSGTDTAWESEMGCYALPSPLTECPPAVDVPPDDVIPGTCGAEVLSVDGAGTLDTGCAWIGGAAPAAWCIYPITVDPPEEPCDYGRPLVIGGRPRLAPLARGRGWAAGADERTDAPDLARAATWARIALAEHASVASFSRFALELLAFGAPADLVADAHTAALDEVRHAKLAFGLAEAAGGEALRPGPLPLAELALADDLAAFAEATAREGCVAETLSALQMAAARDRATDPAERAALAVIARDEARHAALAWRTVRWAIDVGGDAVRDAVTRALAEAPRLPVEAGGLLPVAEARDVITRGWREVVAPAAAALLGRSELHAHA